MKKSFISVVVLILLTVLVSCTNFNYVPPNRPNIPTDKIYFYDLKGSNDKTYGYKADFSSMGTTIELVFYKQDEMIDYKEEAAQKMLDLFNYYHILTDNFFGYEGINNTFYINENPNKKIPILKELYDLLLLSEEIKVFTDGYFDISIGLIIDEWKNLLNMRKPNTRDLNKVLNKVKSIPVIKDGILLENKDDRYFVTIKDGVKIDLGAIAKGYLVNKANEIAKEYGFTYYTVRGSSSSLYYGKNYLKERDYFNIALTKQYDERYGVISVKDISVTTSGDDVQGKDINGYRYHHIISPLTKKPENNRSMMTVIGLDAGISDALTTALFNMPKDVFNKWILKNPLPVVFLNTDDSIELYNMEEYSFRIP